MQPTVEFIYDFVSLPSFLAWKALPPMLESVGAKLICTPVVVTGIQKATGNPGPLVYPAKREWMVRDIARWARKHGVALHPQIRIPFRSLPMLRGSLVAAERDETSRFMNAIYDAAFLQGQDMDDPQVIARALTEAGLDVAAYLQGIERQDIKDKLRRNTDEAVARKVFGVPTYFVNGELFFGQDRLEFVMDALQGR